MHSEPSRPYSVVNSASSARLRMWVWASISTAGLPSGRAGSSADPVQDAGQPGVGLAQDLGFVHGQQLAAAHQDAPVDDGGVDRGPVGREDQMRVQLIGIARDQW